ncbi:MAG: ABC-2 type transport system ATP-binding protein [Crocinitomicaceae bacterium]|jgi:ABC-2 type transport system ATP-binding protein
MNQPTSIWECSNVRKSYSNNGFELKNINLAINAGEITGIVGENGNGKTTLLRVVAGELDIDAGKIQFMGSAIESEDWRSFKEQITYIPQRIPKWYGYLRTNLVFQASIHGIPSNEIDSRLNLLLDELGLQKYADLKWSEISTGYRLRFQLAKMLIGKPKLLVLDEPIANLDIKAQEKFLTDLQRIVTNDEFQTAVIMSSQQLHEVESFSDNVVFIKDGDIKYSGKVEDVGQGRKENTFELSGSMTKELIENLFKDEIISIQVNGKNLSVTTTMAISGESLVTGLLKAECKLDYFRDISSSTKKMFS